MSIAPTKLVTAEELLAMRDIGRCELINGEIIHMAPAGAEHGDLAAKLLIFIGLYAQKNSLGKVYAAETGFIIARNPDTTRAPDVAWERDGRRPVFDSRRLDVDDTTSSLCVRHA